MDKTTESIADLVGEIRALRWWTEILIARSCQSIASDPPEYARQVFEIGRQEAGLTDADVTQRLPDGPPQQAAQRALERQHQVLAEMQTRVLRLLQLLPPPSPTAGQRPTPPR